MGDRRSNVNSSIGEGAHFHVLIEDIMVPMRDGVRLAGDLYIPALDGHVDPARRWPCVLIRTPYNKGAVNPDFRNPGVYWSQNGYACFIQDVRGRFRSEGTFYKYTGEAEDGYDTVEWLAKQPWCNASIVTDGPSYLCHVQTSMALLKPAHLKAMFCNKGGFYNAFTSGVRQGGAFEARQWVWGIKNASRKTPQLKEAIVWAERHSDDWFRRYPWKKGSSPLSTSAEYEDYLFDQLDKDTYSAYWKQMGLNTEEYIDQFMDVPVLFLSGWFDIYCRSTVDFFVNLVHRKKTPTLLIMGPWAHTGQEGHIAGEVDFGINALISGNLAPNVFSLSRRWFDRFANPAVKRHNPEHKLAMAIQMAQNQQLQPNAQHQISSSSNSMSASLNNYAPTSLSNPSLPRGPYTSLSRMGSNFLIPSCDEKSGPTLYVLPDALPRSRLPTQSNQDPLPPPVRYFRMGGGDGHKTTQNCIFHGGIWLQSFHWPPLGTHNIDFFLFKGGLSPSVYNFKANDDNSLPSLHSFSINDKKSAATELVPPDSHDSNEGKNEAGSDSRLDLTITPDTHQPVRCSLSDKRDPTQQTTYMYDPMNPCPTIGGNVFDYKNILLSGSYNQVERSDMFLCHSLSMPLSSRRDVVAFRSEPLTERTDITGHPYVLLYISSDCVDTDFTAKLIDEYPPSPDYPLGFAMLITHGIQRARMRLQNGRGQPSLLEPDFVYLLRIDMYPTSNLFSPGHRIRLDISSSNFPHFDMNLNTGIGGDSQEYKIAANTIWHSRVFPSRLVLPFQSSAPTHHISMEEATH